MPEIARFLSDLPKCDGREYVLRMLAFTLSPVLKKVKPAEIVILTEPCLSGCWEREKGALLQGLSLSCRELWSTRGRACLLFYDRSLLENALSDPEALGLLGNGGYAVKDGAESLLNQLASRMGQRDFPHEVGVFLGYPAPDVAAFIRFGGKNFALCRYWKVYHDVEAARRKFSAIDEAKRRAACLLNSEVPADAAIALLKAG
ncbi:MAG: DUF3793 family protein [Acidaminococcales bacterium]|jgi:hypothetical protein|nr:DUF3793 family protein [Acidaminococcales bacterium]